MEEYALLEEEARLRLSDDRLTELEYVPVFDGCEKIKQIERAWLKGDQDEGLVEGFRWLRESLLPRQVAPVAAQQAKYLANFARLKALPPAPPSALQALSAEECAKLEQEQRDTYFCLINDTREPFRKG
mmetsp:Transcript_16492/g.28010  ORF Transcript_16492/g.28010 Transcript_16492/m.28010 type:complete len:129 (-) Transcript_16492:942-1328(-)